MKLLTNLQTVLGSLLALMLVALGIACWAIGGLGLVYGTAFMGMAIAVVPKFDIGEWNRLSIGATALIVLTFL